MVFNCCKSYKMLCTFACNTNVGNRCTRALEPQSQQMDECKHITEVLLRGQDLQLLEVSLMLLALIMIGVMMMVFPNRHPEKTKISRSYTPVQRHVKNPT